MRSSSDDQSSSSASRAFDKLFGTQQSALDRLQQGSNMALNNVRNFGSQLKNLKNNLENITNNDSEDLSNQLHQLNERMREEAERRDVIRESEALCRKEIKHHLETFLKTKSTEYPTYEQWIEDLHPENAHDPMLLQEMDKEIDLRFYVKESDHLQLWNESVSDPLRQVKPRTRMWKDASKTQLQQQQQQQQSAPIDLLSSDFQNTATLMDNSEKITTNATEGGDLIQF